MPLITWGPKLETGIAIIDSQHKRLVDIINELDEARKADRSQEVLGALLAELVDYTHTHFTVEEKLMANHGYEEIEEHRSQHRRFTDQIDMERDHFEAGSVQIDKRIMEFLRGWLTNHIAISDRAYVLTLKQAGDL